MFSMHKNKQNNFVSWEEEGHSNVNLELYRGPLVYFYGY